MCEYSLTVATATYNRKDSLEMMLNHIAEQSISMEEFEMVLVDDGSSDGTSDFVRKIQNSLPFKLRFYEQEHKGPGAAHNKAAYEASSEIILFLANDMLPTKDVLQSHLNIHRNNPQNNIAAVGEIRESNKVPQTEFQKAWDPFRKVDLSRKKRLDEYDFWVSNLSMKKDYFLMYGIFIEYPQPAMEDLELAYRLFKNGLYLIYNENALSYHYHPQTIDTATHRLYITGKSFARYENMVGHTKGHVFANVSSKKLGLAANIKIRLRDFARIIVFNKYSITHLVMPAIRKAESNELYRPFLRFLTGRACGYYLRKGISEGRKKSASIS